ncbi:MAG: hypothetical protein QW723_05005 [Candidatus Bathyarchaeia archaeon]
MTLSIFFMIFYTLEPLNAQNITEVEVTDYPSQARPGETIYIDIILHYRAFGSFSTILRILDERGSAVTPDVPLEITLPSGNHEGTIMQHVGLEVPEFNEYPHRWHLRAEADSISKSFEIEVVSPDSPPFVEILLLKSYVLEPWEERYQLYEGELFIIFGLIHVSIPEEDLPEALLSIKYRNSPLLYTSPEDRIAEEGLFYFGNSPWPIQINRMIPIQLFLRAPLDYPIEHWEWSFKAEVVIDDEVRASDTKSLMLSVSEKSYSFATIESLYFPSCARPNTEFNVNIFGIYSFLEGEENTFQLTVTRSDGITISFETPSYSGSGLWETMLTLRAPEHEGSYSYNIELRVSGNASVMDQARFDLNVNNECPLQVEVLGGCRITDLRLAYPPAFSESFPVEPPRDVTYGVGFGIYMTIHYELPQEGSEVDFGLIDVSFIIGRTLTGEIELSGTGDYTYFFEIPGSAIPPRNGPLRIMAFVECRIDGIPMHDSRIFQVNVVNAPDEPSGAGEGIDWSISGLQVMPFQPLQGSEAVFQALIQANPIPTEPKQVEVRCSLDGQELFSDYITYEPGEAFHGVQSIPWTVTLGRHTLTWEIDPNEEYNDGNRNNNIARLEFTVVEQFIPPLPEEGEERPLPEEEFDFYVTTSPTEQKLASSITYKINVNLISGSPQPVNLELIGVPAGVSYCFSPSSGVPSYESMLTLTASSRLPAGRYELTINASGGGKERYSPIAFVVEEGPDYSLSITPNSARVKPGETVDFIITASSDNGYDQYINLMVSGLPSGVSWRLEPTALVPNSQSKLSLELSKDAKPGVYTITVIGSGADSKRVFATLRIEGAMARAGEAEERLIDYLAIAFLILILALIIGAFLAIRRSKAARKPKVFCIECGTKLAPGLEYCPKCGTKQPKLEEGVNCYE